MEPVLDDLDRRLIDLLRVNARLPVVRIAEALKCARSTAQLRLKALEDSGAISGYTLAEGSAGVAQGIEALVMVTIEASSEQRALAAMKHIHTIYKIYSVSGRYDFCLFLTAETTEELEGVVDRIRRLPGVSTAFSTILLAKKLDRPGAK